MGVKYILVACVVISAIACCHSLDCYECSGSYNANAPSYDSCMDPYSMPQDHLNPCDGWYCAKTKSNIADNGFQTISRRCAEHCTETSERKCCRDDGCNSAESMVISVAVLLVPVLTFVMNIPGFA